MEGGSALASDPNAGSCDHLPPSYEVRIQDGAGEVLALASFGQPSLKEKKSYNGEILDWTCKWSYQFTAPASSIYRFSLWAKGDSNERDSAMVEGAKASAAPTLATADCFGMPRNSPCLPPE